MNMQQACSGGSCPTPQQYGSSQYGSQGQCGPSGSSSACDSKESCCICPKSMLCDMQCLVKCAKKCLMKDKLKAKLEAKMGDKLDEAAEIAVELFLDQWHHKVGYTKKKHEMEDRLAKLIMSSNS